MNFYHYFVGFDFPNFIKFITALSFLLVASIKDLKSREVWDWLSYTFLAYAFLVNLFFTVAYENYFFILSSLLGFGFAWFLSIVLFYLGQWGGGDAKISFALGALLGINYKNMLDPYSFFGFLLSLLLTAWVYGIIYVLIIFFKKRRRIHPLIEKWFLDNKRVFIILVFLLILDLIFITIFIKDSFITLINIFFVALFILIYFLIGFIRIIEGYGFLKKTNINSLVPGDWITETIIIDNPGLSFFDYLLIKQEDDFNYPSFLYRKVFSFFHPKKNLRKYLIKRFKNKIMKHFSIDGKILNIKTFEELKKIVPKKERDKLINLMRSEGFLIDENKIILYEPNPLGILSSQIDLLKKYSKKQMVNVKEGVPFIPAFLFALIFQFCCLPFVFHHILFVF